MHFLSCAFSGLLRNYHELQVDSEDLSFGRVVMKYLNQPEIGLKFQTYRQVSNLKIIYNLASVVS